MNFSEQKAIYLQIAELIENNILNLVWAEGERMPSVREFGVQLAVNPATVLRAYDELSSKEVIEQRRGIGYFVRENAITTVKNYRRESFLTVTLPNILQQMQSLDITPEELIELYNKNKDG